MLNGHDADLRGHALAGAWACKAPPQAQVLQAGVVRSDKNHVKLFSLGWADTFKLEMRVTVRCNPASARPAAPCLSGS